MKVLHKEGRLAAAQIFVGDGRTSFIAVGFYGYAGACWGPQLLQENNKAIAAIFEFAATKLSLPVLLFADFNIEVNECAPLQDTLTFGQWFDAAGADQTPTCLKAKNGSYSVRPGILKKDNQIVTIHLQTPLACQHEYCVKTSSYRREFAKAPESRTHPVRNFQPVFSALQQDQIESAWSIWSKLAEECLLSIPLASTGSPALTYKTGKGKIRFRRQRVFPKQYNESATTLETVRWSKIFAPAERTRPTHTFRVSCHPDMEKPPNSGRVDQSTGATH